MLAAADSAAPPRAPPTPSPAAAAVGEGEPRPCPELSSARQALADAVTRAAAAAMLTCRAHRRSAEHSAQHAVRQAALRLLREMRLATWAACAFCYKLKCRAAVFSSAVARRLDAARWAHVLLLRRSPPRALTCFDVGVSPKGAPSPSETPEESSAWGTRPRRMTGSCLSAAHSLPTRPSASRCCRCLAARTSLCPTPRAARWCAQPQLRPNAVGAAIWLKTASGVATG